MARLAGRYELQTKLAEGGMAEVWLATAHGEAGFTRRVAIKQLFHRTDEGGAFERMFLDEARITSRLHHPNIVGILDFGVEAGRAFQVLELVDGFDAWRLARWGRERGSPMPPAVALHICAVVGHALHYAHTATADDGSPLRIVHRDVSPQNVLLARTGDVKLSDFGIALAEGRLEKTVAGVTRGKPAYMAPEQAIRGALDARTDVFALGCVLHALLTGESALKDENALVDLLSGIDLELSSALPEDVRALVARATRRSKSERYESAEEMALACEALRARLDASDPRRALAAWVAQVMPPRPELRVGAPGGGATSGSSASATSSGRRVVLVVASALLVGGLAFLAVRVERAPAVVQPAPGEAAVVPKPLEASASAAVEPSQEPPASGLLDAGPRELEEPPTPGAGAELPKRKPRREVAAEQGTGVLSIGGEALLRGEVLIDGVSRGFAPGRFELSVGPHRVEVLTPDGQRRTRELTLTRRHTTTAPLAWVE